MSEGTLNRHDSFSEQKQRLERRRKMYDTRYGERLANQSIELQRITPADSELWDAVGRLRKKVYIDENHYLPKEAADEEGREYDKFDEYDDTVHFCASDNEGNVVGYARILTKGPDGHRLLPTEEAFRDQLEEKKLSFGSNYTEVSRLIVDREFAGGPLVTSSLIRAVSHELNGEEKYSATTLATLEPFLERYLRDIIGVPVGELIGMTYVPEYKSENKLVAIWPQGIVARATELDNEGRRLAVLPDRMGPFFADMQESRGLGRIALSLRNFNEIQEDSHV